MTAKDLILEVLEVQSRIAGLETQVRGFNIESDNINSKIRSTEAGKAEALTGKKNAQVSVDNINEQVGLAQSLVSEAKKNLAKVQKEQKEAEAKLTEYSNEMLMAFDNSVTALKKSLKANEKKRDALLEELRTVRADLDTKQKELRDQGYELNIGQPKQSNSVNL